MAAEIRVAAARRLLQHAVSTAVEPHDFGPPTGPGLRCTRDVEAGGVLLEVPIASAITSKFARAQVLAELGLNSAERLPEATPQDFLCLWLLLERGKGEASAFATFNETLPTQVEEMSAAYWPEDVLAELQGGEASVRLSGDKERVESMYQRVRRAVQAAGPEVEAKVGGCLSLEGYVWARCILNSRQFEGSWHTDEEEKGILVPLVDMINHDCALPEGHCVRRGGGGAGETLEVVALRRFAEGEEAMISYGHEGSARLLERGFAVEGNPDECIELIMGARCSAARVPELLAAGAVDEEFEWLQPPAADADEAEARITVRTRRPLPETLLALSRLECLRDEDLATSRASRSAAPWGMDCERAALTRLMAVAEAMVGRFATSPAEDVAALSSATGLRRMAVVARLGEKEAFCAMARAAYERLVRLLAVMEGRTAEAVGGSVWFCLLRDLKPRLEAAQQSGAFAQHFRRLQTLPVGGRSPPASEAIHTWGCSQVFLWLHDCLSAPSAAKTPGPNELIAWVEEQDIGGAAGKYLQLYFEKMALWGRYLVAQFACSGGFGLSEMNTMQMETVGIRNSNAWSVPTDDALRTLASYEPLVEVGCGNGVWAQAIKDRGADIVAFDTAAWDAQYGERDDDSALMGERMPLVQAGGPEQVAAHRDRALMLMWPDYMGKGSFGTSCLDGYVGEVLLLVGEWRDSTLGRVNPWGQSFSEDFVGIVERDFVMEQRLQLPCWPVALDTLMVWRRRRR